MYEPQVCIKKAIHSFYYENYDTIYIYIYVYPFWNIYFDGDFIWKTDIKKCYQMCQHKKENCKWIINEDNKKSFQFSCCDIQFYALFIWHSIFYDVASIFTV